MKMSLIIAILILIGLGIVLVKVPMHIVAWWFLVVILAILGIFIVATLLGIDLNSGKQLNTPRHVIVD